MMTPNERSPSSKTPTIVLNEELSVTSLNNKLEGDLDLERFRHQIPNLGQDIN